jgi:hypothetical protein
MSMEATNLSFESFSSYANHHPQVLSIEGPSLEKDLWFALLTTGLALKRHKGNTIRGEGG